MNIRKVVSGIYTDPFFWKQECICVASYDHDSFSQLRPRNCVPCYDKKLFHAKTRNTCKTNVFRDMSTNLLSQGNVFRAVCKITRVFPCNRLCSVLVYDSQQYHHHSFFMTCHASNHMSPTNITHHYNERKDMRRQTASSPVSCSKNHDSLYKILYYRFELPCMCNLYPDYCVI